MNCTDVNDLITRYLEEDLASDESAEVEAHLHECADCAKIYRARKSAKSLLLRLKTADEAEKAPATAAVPLRRDEYLSGGKPSVNRFGWFAAAAAAAVVVGLVVASSLSIFDGGKGIVTPPGNGGEIELASPNGDASHDGITDYKLLFEKELTGSVKNFWWESDSSGFYYVAEKRTEKSKSTNFLGGGRVPYYFDIQSKRTKEIKLPQSAKGSEPYVTTPAFYSYSTGRMYFSTGNWSDQEAFPFRKGEPGPVVRNAYGIAGIADRYTNLVLAATVNESWDNNDDWPSPLKSILLLREPQPGNRNFTLESTIEWRVEDVPSTFYLSSKADILITTSNYIAAKLRGFKLTSDTATDREPIWEVDAAKDDDYPGWFFRKTLDYQEGKFVVVACTDLYARIWNTETKELAFKFKPGGAISYIEESRHLYTFEDGRIKRYAFYSNEKGVGFEPDAEFSAGTGTADIIAVSPDEKYIAIGAGKKLIVLGAGPVKDPSLEPVENEDGTITQKFIIENADLAYVTRTFVEWWSGDLLEAKTAEDGTKYVVLKGTAEQIENAKATLAFIDLPEEIKNARVVLDIAIYGGECPGEAEFDYALKRSIGSFPTEKMVFGKLVREGKVRRQSLELVMNNGGDENAEIDWFDNALDKEKMGKLATIISLPARFRCSVDEDRNITISGAEQLKASQHEFDPSKIAFKPSWREFAFEAAARDGDRIIYVNYPLVEGISGGRYVPDVEDVLVLSARDSLQAQYEKLRSHFTTRQTDGDATGFTMVIKPRLLSLDDEVDFGNVDDSAEWTPTEYDPRAPLLKIETDMWETRYLMRKGDYQETDALPRACPAVTTAGGDRASILFTNWIDRVSDIYDEDGKKVGEEKAYYEVGFTVGYKVSLADGRGIDLLIDITSKSLDEDSPDGPEVETQELSATCRTIDGGEIIVVVDRLGGICKAFPHSGNAMPETLKKLGELWKELPSIKAGKPVLVFYVRPKLIDLDEVEKPDEGGSSKTEVPTAKTALFKIETDMWETRYLMRKGDGEEVVKKPIHMPTLTVYNKQKGTIELFEELVHEDDETWEDGETWEGGSEYLNYRFDCSLDMTPQLNRSGVVSVGFEFTETKFDLNAEEPEKPVGTRVWKAHSSTLDGEEIIVIVDRRGGICKAFSHSHSEMEKTLRKLGELWNDLPSIKAGKPVLVFYVRPKLLDLDEVEKPGDREETPRIPIVADIVWIECEGLTAQQYNKLIYSEEDWSGDWEEKLLKRIRAEGVGARSLSRSEITLLEGKGKTVDIDSAIEDIHRSDLEMELIVNIVSDEEFSVKVTLSYNTVPRTDTAETEENESPVLGPGKCENTRGLVRGQPFILAEFYGSDSEYICAIRPRVLKPNEIETPGEGDNGK